MLTCAIVGPRLCDSKQPQLHYSKTSYVDGVNYCSIAVTIDSVRVERSILTRFQESSMHPGGNGEQQEQQVEAGDNMAEQVAERE